MKTDAEMLLALICLVKDRKINYLIVRWNVSYKKKKFACDVKSAASS